MPEKPLRHPGPRWSIAYGAYQGIEKFVLEELHRTVQSRLPYTVEISPAGAAGQPEHVLMVGTPQNTPLVAQLAASGVLCPPDTPQGFEIRGMASPWDPHYRLVVVAARQPEGVLYGVETFNARLLAFSSNPIRRSPGLPRTLMEDFHLNESPRIAHRGLWSWGYVIYDYRRYLDAMARLRLNTLIMWNDVPPLNCREMIDYAHARGVRVVLGFSWGWGREYNLANLADRQRIEEEVLRHYLEWIEPLHPDGIYFQTLTEHSQTALEDHTVAALTCDLVNRISARLFEITPILEIQFGLHATSIGENFADLKTLDPRVDILWEDAGALPFAYLPTLKDRGRSFAETLAYSKSLAGLRPGAGFGMVAKGWTTLDWEKEFEHHPPYLLGEQPSAFLQRRLAQRRARWRLVNLLWYRLFPKAAEFYRAMLEVNRDMTVIGLVEDGVLEERIQPSVAMFAETLWNPLEDHRSILRRARSRYYAE